MIKKLIKNEFIINILVLSKFVIDKKKYASFFSVEITPINPSNLVRAKLSKILNGFTDLIEPWRVRAR